MEQKNKTTVQIFGAEYTLVGEESEEYIQTICMYVDRLMRSLSSGGLLPAAKIPVLAAINLSDSYHKLLKENEELKKAAAEMPEKGEMEGLRQENRYLKEELQRLKKELSRHGK